MSRDYKNSGTAATGGRGSSIWIGILIGLLVGLCIALGIALYINKGTNPFLPKQKVPEKHAKAGDAKPRFDFYKILPGSEEAVTDKEFKRAAPAVAKEVYFLQIAAF